MQSELETDKKEFSKLKDIAENTKEYSDLEYLSARVSGIGYDNFENILEDEFYKINKKEPEEKEQDEIIVEEDRKPEDDLDLYLKNYYAMLRNQYRSKNKNRVENIVEENKEPEDKDQDEYIHVLEEDREPEEKDKDENTVEENREPEEKDKKPYLRSIRISEKDGKVTLLGINKYGGRILNEGKIFKRSFRDYLEKKQLYKDMQIKELCNEIAENNKKAKELKKCLNPSIINVLQNKKDIKEYVEATYYAKKLPFELIHDLKGLNIAMNFLKVHSKQFETEEKCGAIILNRDYDKNKALYGKKENKEKIEPEIIEEDSSEEKQTDKNVDKKTKFIDRFKNWLFDGEDILDQDDYLEQEEQEEKTGTDFRRRLRYAPKEYDNNERDAGEQPIIDLYEIDSRNEDKEKNDGEER